MSARLFGALCADLPGLNLAELNNGLKTMCAAAYSQHPQEPVIVLKAMDLPPELLGRLPLSQVRKPSESTPLPVEQFRRQDGSDQILKLFDHLLESHRHYYNEHRVRSAVPSSCCSPKFQRTVVQRERPTIGVVEISGHVFNFEREQVELVES